MKYVYFGRTWHDPKQFEDRIMPQTDFESKFGRPNATGNIMIDNEMFSVYIMDLSLSDTMDFAIKFRQKHKQLNYVNLS